MLKKFVILVALTMLLTACGKTIVVTKDCLFARVILISQADVLTLGTAEQIEENNLNVESIC